MRIKITPENAEKIEAALLAVNDKAVEHTYTCYADILGVVAEAAAKLSAILPAKNFPGAKAYAESGGSVAKAYKYARRTTAIKIERGATGWFLIEIAESGAHEKADKLRLILTEEQKALAVSLFEAKLFTR